MNELQNDFKDKESDQICFQKKICDDSLDGIQRNRKNTILLI